MRVQVLKAAVYGETTKFGLFCKSKMAWHPLTDELSALIKLGLISQNGSLPRKIYSITPEGVKRYMEFRTAADAIMPDEEQGE